MILNFSAPIEAADVERRTITGTVMEFGAVGHTSVGKVVFQKGSIYIKDTAKIKLLAQHDSNNPIGRATAFSTEGNFIHAAFKLSASDMGTRYLTLASEDLVSGLSVGVDVTASEPKDGYLLVTAAKLQEISLVSAPHLKMRQSPVFLRVKTKQINQPNQQKARRS